VIDAQSIIDLLISQVRRFGFEQIFQRYYGIYPAIVDDVEDDEGRGRIRVRVAALGQKKAPESIWALPAVYGGSEGSGVFFPPAKDDRVWVQFQGGNPSKPVYMGGFLGKGKAADEFGDYFKRGIRTPAGHWIRFSDEDGDEHITVSAIGGGFATLDKDGSFEIKNGNDSIIHLDAVDQKTTITDEGGSTVVMDNGEVVVTSKDGGTKLTMTSTGFTVDGGASAVIEVSGNVTLRAATVNIGKGAKESVVLGDSFLSYFNTHFHSGNLGVPTGTPIVPMVKGVHTSLAVKTK